MNGLLLILAVLLPIVAGIASYVLPLSEKTRRIFCSCAIFATTVIGWLAILTCSEEKVVLFSFTDNLIFSLRMDGAAKLFVGLSATLWPFTTVYAWDYMKHEGHLPMFWAFFTASFGITLGIATASNMVTMYLFYELLTLSTIPLVMHAMHRKAIAAGIKYALYSIAGAALAFVGLVYLIVNDAQDFVLGGHFANFNGNMTVLLTVFSLAFVGCGVKAAIFPLHSWLPTAAVAPTPVTALLHAVAVVKAGAFACIRLVYYAFGVDVLRGTWGQYVVMCLAIVTLVFGSAMALKQTHFKHRLAYSTVSNLSYILFACALMTPEGLVASWVHLIVHSVVKIMAFFCAGSVLHYAHREYVHELDGLAKRMPLTFIAFTAAACALTGIPPFNGFVSKWYIALSAMGEGSIWATLGFVGVLISALLTAIYMFQVVIKAWFPAKDVPAIEAGSAHEAGPMMTVPILILATACLLMGLFPQWLLDIIREAVML